MALASYALVKLNVELAQVGKQIQTIFGRKPAEKQKRVKFLVVEKYVT